MKALVWLLLSYLICLPVWGIEQICNEPHCVQVGTNDGTINIEGSVLQVAINNGTVNIIGKPEDKAKIAHYETKTSNLEAQITEYFAKLQAQEDRHLTDQEKILKATEYVAKVTQQLDQLNKRIALLDQQHELTQKILAAKDRFDIPEIKRLLKEKQQLDDKKAAETAFELAGFQRIDLEYKDAFKNYQKAVYLEPDNPEYLKAAGSMAGILAKHKKEIEWNTQALKLYITLEGEDAPNTAALRNNLGEAYRALGQYEKAIKYYKLALTSDLKTYGEDHPSVAIGRNNLGLVYDSLGQYTKAIELYQLALASDLKTYGEDHPSVAIPRANLGGAYYSLGQYDKAIELFQLALTSDLKTYGEDHPNVAIRRWNLGAAYRQLGQYDKAIEYYQLALAVFEKVLGKEHPYSIGTLQHLRLAEEANAKSK